MTGFEPRTSSLGSDCSANCATTTALFIVVATAVADVVVHIANVDRVHERRRDADADADTDVSSFIQQKLSSLAFTVLQK